MRIGILTYWTSNDNYGQLLQCYALQQVLRDMGHDPYLIRFIHNEKKTIGKKIIDHMSWSGIKYLFSTQRRLSKNISNINAKQNVLRHFDNFRNEYITVSERIYYGLQELRSYPPKADIYICGSDQVWNNPLALTNTPAWFLAFGKKQTRRVSYAASIGRELEKKEIPVFKHFLSLFDKISVREESTYSLCNRLGFYETKVTLDPTLLLPAKKYREITSKTNIQSKPYLFMYILNISTEEEMYWNAVKKYLHRQNLELKIVYSSGYIQAQQLIKDYPNTLATIPEWINYIDHAQCIITTSFHGVVFCIKMHKPFLAILLTNQFSKGNDRIVSLLNSLNLSERIYDPSHPISSQMERDINWENVENKLLKLQTESYNFLKSL